MVRSAVDSWLNNPLSEICAIFEEKYSKKQTLDIFSDFDVQRCFLSVFCSNSQREKIPSLESTPTESLDTGKLVRMTCRKTWISFFPNKYYFFRYDSGYKFWSRNMYGCI